MREILDMIKIIHPSDTFWVFVTGFFTGLLAYVAWFQLKGIKKQSSADFIHKLKTDFFQQDTRKIIRLIDNDELKFEGKDFNENVTSHDMDDFVLGILEDVGTFEKRGILDIGLVYDFFDYYIDIVWNNCAIRKYIEYAREGQSNGDVYENIEFIFNKLKSYQDAKNKNKSMLIWRFKWFIKANILKII